MGIIRFAIENPVKITVAVILVVLFGLLSLFEIPVQLTPDVDRPIITVETYWRGASPEEIESEIVDRQEEKLKSVSNLQKMTSSSREGQATINLEFPVYVDRDIAYRDVSDKLRQVTGYPEEVDEPVILAADANDMSTTIAWLILFAEDGRDIAHLKTFVEDQIKPQLERADGVAEVPVYGGRDREIQIEVDAHLLAARELTFRDLEQALRGQNKNISAGTIAQGKRDYTYRTIGEYRRIADIEETVIAHRGGGPIRVRDVATVHDGLKKQYAFVRSKGKYVLAMPAKRETGANVIQTMRELNERVVAVNHDLLEPQGLGLTLVRIYDETDYIWSSIGLVVQNMFIGGLLAVVVLLLFLRDGSATGIIAVAIPISVIGTFLVITLLGRTLNVILLAGMAFAVGMVVDNAIVVLENIYRHRAMGKSRREAAFDGAREVWGAVLASTLTTMAVFLPVITIREEAGQLFKDIAVAIAVGVGLSLIVSVLVIPPMASRFFHAARAHKSGGDKPWRFAVWVSSLVALINRRISTRLAVVAGLSGLAIAGSWVLVPAAEYLPLGNKNLVFGFIFSPPGYSIEEFQRMAQLVEEGDPDDPYDGLRYAWEAELDSPEALHLPPVDIALGKGGETVRTVVPPPIENFFFVGYGGAAFMGATSKEETNVKPLEYVLRRAGRRIPGVFNDARQASLFASGGHRGAATIDVEIRGDDMDAVAASAGALVGKLMEKGFGYPAPDPANFALGQPEVRFVPDRTKAADLGLNVQDLGFVLEATVDGAFVGEFNDHGDKIDMVIAVAGTDGATVEEVAQTPIYTPTGHIVPLASIVDVRRTTAPQQINHSEQMNSITLSVTPQTGVPLQETMRDLEEEIITPLRAEGVIPPTVFVVLAGTADRLTQTQHSLIGNFENVVQRPRIAGLSVAVSIGLLL
ncbi:MAG: efflux RND transporter permease subunit, partial [Planctomycetes bacterium]|nr:efflux RND transporter permease subunit [Planctomycetota bacterium]